MGTTQYDVTVIVKHTFTVDADSIDGAFLAAGEYDEHWADSTVERVTVSQPGGMTVERGA